MNLAEFYQRARTLAPTGRTVIVSVTVQSPPREPPGTPEGAPRVRWEAWVSPEMIDDRGDHFEARTAEQAIALMAQHFLGFDGGEPTPIPNVTDDGLTVKS